MLQRMRRLRRDESGMSMVFIGFTLMAVLSASMLAIDVGMLMTARNQAQNSADAGALAGATALVYDSFTDHTPGGPAVTSAIAAATANNVMGSAVWVTPDDVQFLPGLGGQINRVQVTVRRSAATGNPVSTLIARYFGISNTDIVATATAEASPANAMTCVKPFVIPDKWIEMQTPPWDGDDTYDAFDNKGNPLPKPDVYVPAGQSGYTGYNQEANRGQRLTIRAGTGNNITVSFYFSLTIGGLDGGLTGADAYRWNIANCNRTLMHFGDRLIQEPGAVEGPTLQGAEDLIAKDPGAYWDEGTKTVKGSNESCQECSSRSPRVFPIPLYDPIVYDSGKRNGRYADLVLANWIGFFLEEVQGNQIWGRIIPIGGIYDRNAAAAPSNAFPLAIRLVK